jgi:phospholipid/cholesterol/gamma-HCH transport system ATP-binding protein
MIRVEDLHKSFDGLDVLRGVSFQIKRGEILALIGRSGFGKSVLLKHIAGLMRPDRGRVLVNGEDICCLRGKSLQRVRSRFAFVFQSGGLFDPLTVFENVAFPLRERARLSDREIRERVLCELDQVGLTRVAHKYPGEISTGTIKRAVLARALVREPEIMFFDEPTTGLDPIVANALLNLIESCHKRLNFTGVIATHQIPRIFEIVQKVAMLHEGAILLTGPPGEILSCQHPVIKQFISGDIEGPIDCH